MVHMNVEQAIQEYLPTVIHMSLATCVDGKPWVCEVHFAWDDELNLYWSSKPSRRHSQDIARNPNVAGNIVVQHEPGQKPRGVYFEGTAELLTGVTEDSVAYRMFASRFSERAKMILDRLAEPDSEQFYKVNVADWYVFDARETSPGQKYHLDR
jgi:uncharacterized protein YhbP (UPF0306 family)